MKKKLFIIALALCLLLTACAVQPTPGQTHLEQTHPEQTGGETTGAEDPFNSPEPMPGFDAQNQYMLTSSISFQETDGFFYGSSLVGNFMRYYDKSTGISGVLCADPSCTHDSSACSGYVQSGATMALYDGHLYWISEDPQSSVRDLYLWRGDLTGSNREKLKKISMQDVLLPYQPQQYFIHRGNLYILGLASAVDGMKTGYRAALLSSPLDNSEAFTALFDGLYEQGVEQTVRFVGNAVYYSLVTFAADGPYTVKITKYDVKTKSSETVFEKTNMTETPGAIWVTEQGEVYLPGTGEDCTWVWKLEDGKQAEVISWPGNRLSVPKVLNGIAVQTRQQDGIPWVEIKDLSGKTVYNGQLFPEKIPGVEEDPNTFSRMIVGGDGEKLVMNISSFSGTGLADYTVLLDIRDGMKPTLLWSNE